MFYLMNVYFNVWLIGYGILPSVPNTNPINVEPHIVSQESIEVKRKQYDIASRVFALAKTHS
jgi:hypothetical protein